MPMSLALTPTGHLHIKQTSEADIADPALIKDFQKGVADGMLNLAIKDKNKSAPHYLHFWRDVAISYFKALSMQVNGEQVKLTPEQLQDFVNNIPPMPGAEYACEETFNSIWQELESWSHAHIEKKYKNKADFLKHHFPTWQQLGRVCFHLAENKNDPECPFAFIATYATANTADTAKPQYQPLGRALKEYAVDNNTEALLTLLKPVYHASKQCAWLADLINTNDIYHPLAWTPEEGYALLKSVPILEESGILVRLPNWWKKRAKAQVKISIGEKKQGSFNANALLDFNLDLVVDGKALTANEQAELLSSEQNGLVSLRGQWVEVDQDKLKQALDHWRNVQTEIGHDGIGFIEGMRLLAGADRELSGDDNALVDNDSWAFVNPGKWMLAALTKLRDPALIAEYQPGDLLKATLRPYQSQGVSWLHFLSELGLGACLADDMGLGKTIQIISLLLIKKKKNNKTKPSLIVLPASLLANWKSELKKFAPSLNALFFHTSEMSKQKINELIKDPDATLQSKDIVLTTYGMLSRQKSLQEQTWNLIILDEAQAIKNPGARQTQSVKKLNGQSRIALTGTPVENKLGDLWSLFDYLSPGLLGSAGRFQKFIKACEKKEANQFVPLRNLVQPYILRRLKTDKKIIQDLPDKTEMEAWCGLTKTQAKLYMDAVAELDRALSNELLDLSGIKRKGLVLSFIMRFKQICNHTSHLLGDGVYDEKDSGKFIRLNEIAEEVSAKQEKMLIFTQFREMTKPIALFLEKVFGEPGLVLHGGTAVAKRKKLVDAFQSEEGPSFFVLSLKAGGTGLNLTAANHVVHFDRWWNPAVENQATDRAFRIGQKRNVLVHKFICRGTIEEKINQLMNEKKQLATDVLTESGSNLLTEMDDKALLSMVALDLDKAL